MLHWDRKLARTVTRTKKERFAVLVNEPLHNKVGILLGIPLMEDENGIPPALALPSFNMPRISSAGKSRTSSGLFPFDTTASNTGIIRGATTRVEIYLNRRVLWLAC